MVCLSTLTSYSSPKLTANYGYQYSAPTINWTDFSHPSILEVIPLEGVRSVTWFKYHLSTVPDSMPDGLKLFHLDFRVSGLNGTKQENTFFDLIFSGKGEDFRAGNSIAGISYFVTPVHSMVTTNFGMKLLMSPSWDHFVSQGSTGYLAVYTGEMKPSFSISYGEGDFVANSIPEPSTAICLFLIITLCVTRVWKMV